MKRESFVYETAKTAFVLNVRKTWGGIHFKTPEYMRYGEEWILQYEDGSQLVTSRVRIKGKEDFFPFMSAVWGEVIFVLQTDKIKNELLHVSSLEGEMST